MKVVELVKISSEALKMMSKNDVMLDDWPIGRICFKPMESAYINVDDKWGVAIGYNLRPLDEYKVRSSLMNIGIRGDNLEEAISILFDYKNTGMCVSVPELRMSLIYIGDVSSEEQFWDTVSHELYHATQAICDYYGADVANEDGAWTMGYLMRKAVGQIAEPCK